MPKTALVFLAEGAEEMEFVITVDVLRRAGVEVTAAGFENKPVTCSRKVVISPDTCLASVKDKSFDVVILPGGLGGAEALAKSTEVGDILRKQEKDGKLIAAICAAPTALLQHKIGLGKKITSYPSFKEKLASSYQYEEQNVVQDGQLITSRGPGTAFEFGLKIAEVLEGAEVAKKVQSGMLL